MTRNFVYFSVCVLLTGSPLSLMATDDLEGWVWVGDEGEVGAYNGDRRGTLAATPSYDTESDSLRFSQSSSDTEVVGSEIGGSEGEDSWELPTQSRSEMIQLGWEKPEECARLLESMKHDELKSFLEGAPGEFTHMILGYSGVLKKIYYSEMTPLLAVSMILPSTPPGDSHLGEEPGQYVEELVIEKQSKLPGEGFHFLDHLRGLHKLSVREKRIGNEGLRAILPYTTHMPDLEVLSLKNIGLQKEGLEELAGFIPELHHLRTLDLRGNRAPINTWESFRALFQRLKPGLQVIFE